MTTLPRPDRSRWVWVVLLSVALVTLMRMVSYYAGRWHRQLTYSEFYRLLEENPSTKAITEAKLVDGRI